MKFYVLALAGVFAIATANAVEVTSLYTAQVPLDQQQDDPRAVAYETALAQVLLRVSGTQVVNDRDLFDTLFPNPTAYVVQYYPGPDETLFVTFDGTALEEILARSGQPLWGSDRPLTLVWIAVDWGRGEREIIAAEDEEQPQARSINRDRLLRRRVLDFAERRGLPVAFPLLDSEDRAGVSFSDIWGGFNSRVLEASERYDVNSVLIGRVSAAGASRSRWTYYFGRDQREWVGEPELVITQISDLLAEEFSIGGNAPLSVVQIEIAGISTVGAYADLQSTLAGVNVIDSISIVEVSGDVVRYRVTAHGGADRLARALRFEGLIEEERIDMGDMLLDEPINSLRFFYSP